MIDKENIFNYATKELSQDAFLRWLFENWDSKHKDVKAASLNMIKDFLDLPEQESINISYLYTKSQEFKIDILVFLEVNQTKHLIAIEDKTYSFEHSDQLERYKAYLEKYYSDHIIHCVFYKTSTMLDPEISFIKSKKWKIYDIDSINSLFDTIDVEIKHYLLKNYRSYINELNTYFMGELPSDIKTWNLKHWQNYAINHTIQIPLDIDTMMSSYRNQYYMFAYNFKDYWDKGPYLEFRSREVMQGNFSMKILMYGLDEQLINDHINKWKENIKTSNLFKVQNHKKQIGTSILKENINNINDLEKVVVKYIQEFSRIMKI